METGLASLWPISVLTEALNCYFDAITVTLPMEMGHSIGPTVVFMTADYWNISHMFDYLV